MATKKVILSIDPLKMALIPENNIPKAILAKLEGRESFKDTDVTLRERIFPVSVLNDILEETVTLSEGEKQELESIYKQIEKFDYILLGRV